MSAVRVYLAGPEVFLPNCSEIQLAKQALCAENGLVGVAPGDADVAEFPDAHDKGLAISARDETLMDGAHAIIANLTPFRGIGADPGTCYELGYMSAQGKPAFAYTNAATPHRERILEFYRGQLARDENGLLRGEDGLLVEDFGMVDNLMLQGGIERRGGAVVVGNAQANDMCTDLNAFEKVVKIAACDLL